MDSLVYLGAIEDESEEEGEEDSIEEQHQQEPKRSASKQPTLDYEALQRAGYKSAGNLKESDTYKKLEEQDARTREGEELAREAAEAAAAERAAALEAEKSRLLNPKKLDESLGYEKRYAKTQESFRNKEKRKRDIGQQSRDGNWVEEEKRKLRHSLTGNYDS